MTNIIYAPIVLVVAMVVYLLFALIRRATRNPARERYQIAKTDRRLDEIDKAAGYHDLS